MVENHDVYYHNTVFEKWSENRLSVSQLFVGFLDYYARFDFETQVGGLLFLGLGLVENWM